MDKMKMETPDLAQENFEKLAALFPNCVTERQTSNGRGLEKAIDFEKLKQMLSDHVLDGEEAYEFTWVGKKAAIVEANRPIRKTLRPCVEESKEWDTTQNLYIEGDNLEALKLLQESYLGKVKMIYIDPPYNTGNDLIYQDDFAESLEDYEEKSGDVDEDGNRLRVNHDTDGRYHSKWCSMIYARLLCARSLLRQDGIIFMSIDDNEIDNLKKMADEVFGLQNFLGQITVVSNPRGRDYGGIARMHEYILAYQKSGFAHINLIQDSENTFKLFDELGGFELRELRNRNIKFNKENRPNLYYPFYIDENDVDKNGLHAISLEKKEGWVELYPLESQGVNTVWRWGKEKSLKNLNVNIKAKPMRNGSYMIVEKYREARKMARSVWWDKESNTEKGTLLVKDLFGAKVFDYPKPVEMIMRLIEMGTDPASGDVVLDFFSGSATTAHAVMEQNKEDHGNRTFIMMQVPEKTEKTTIAYKNGYRNICSIGKARIRNAGKQIAGEIDTGFRVLKIDSSNMNDVYYSAEDLTQDLVAQAADNIKPDRSDLDLLFGCLVDWGVELSLPYTSETIDGCTVHDYADGALIACFDRDVPESVVRAIAERQPERAVFRDSSFADSPAKINVAEIFKLLSPDTDVRVL